VLGATRVVDAISRADRRAAGSLRCLRRANNSVSISRSRAINIHSARLSSAQKRHDRSRHCGSPTAHRR
jgi:hypothetical protein